MSNDDIWNNFLKKIKSKVSLMAYNYIFKDLKLYSYVNSKIIIVVPNNELLLQNINKNYNQIIEETLNDITDDTCDIEYIFEKDIETIKQKKTEIINDNNDTLENDLSNYKYNSNFNSKYTFDTFVVGESNKLAYGTALAVAKNPGKLYNPYFIYANSGLGKTHLMHAIGNFIVENSNKKVLYVTSEQFRQDFVKANRKDEKGSNFNYVDFFKDKYRNIDVLLIDDIQFLGGASKSQEEFFHTFNNLHDNSKQIIISSDRSPDDLKLLEERLRTRFCWGLQVNIFPPELPLRKEILKNKIVANDFNEDIPEEVIEYMANNIGPDVRQLEGAVTRLVAYSTMMGGVKIDLDLAIEALKDFISKGIGEKNDIQRIQKIVSEYFQITVEDIRSKKRSSNISFPRQIAMYLCRTMTTESFPKIAIEFGGKDHSTVMYSVDKIENEIKVNKDLANIIEKLKKDIGIV